MYVVSTAFNVCQRAACSGEVGKAPVVAGDLPAKTAVKHRVTSLPLSEWSEYVCSSVRGILEHQPQVLGVPRRLNLSIEVSFGCSRCLVRLRWDTASQQPHATRCNAPVRHKPLGVCITLRSLVSYFIRWLFLHACREASALEGTA